MGRITQVEMGVEIDYPDTRGGLATEMFGQPGPTAERHFMAAANHQRQMTGVQQRADVVSEACLGRFQVAVLAGHVTGVIGRRLAMPGQVGQGLAYALRRAGSTDATLVAAHAFVAGKTQQRQARLAVFGQRLDALVPARAVGFRVGATAPGGHAVTISEHKPPPR